MSLIPRGGKQQLLKNKGTKVQGDKGTNPLATEDFGRRTDYQKKAAYLGSRHQDTLDDLAKAMRRRNLPDDRSMILRALLDLAQQQLGAEDAEAWLERMADACRNTLPGTSKQ